MNKKGIIFDIGLTAMTFVVLLLIFIALSSKIDKFADIPIGKRQADLIKTYQRAESALFYIDESAKLSAYQSSYDLAADGGYYNKSSCGSYFGYSLWNNDSDKCYPETKKDYGILLNENLNHLLGFYSDALIPQNNYGFVIRNNQIMGFAFRNLEIVQEYVQGIGNPYDNDNKIKVCTKGSCVADRAKHYAGLYLPLPYVWGGESPYSYEISIKDQEKGADSIFNGVWLSETQPSGSPRSGSLTIPGFDCSGLVWWIMKHSGIKEFDQRKSAAGYLEIAKQKAKKICSLDSCTQDIIKDLKEGDVLFIHPCPERGVCHIAVYVGGGEIVESTGKTGPVKRKIPSSYMPGASRQIHSVYRFNYPTTAPDVTDVVIEPVESSFDIAIESFSGVEYSIKPSFKVSIDYDISDYGILEQQSEELLTCQFEQELEACIDRKIEEDFKFQPSQLPGGYYGTAVEPSKFIWSKGSCDRGYEFIFYNFLELFDSCKNSLDDNCICNFNLDYSEKEIKENYLEGDYRFNLISDGSDIKARLEKPVKKELVIKDSPIYALDEVKTKAKFDIGYSDKKIDLAIINFEPALDKPLKQIILLKKDDKLTFVSSKGSYGECELYKEKYKFCVVIPKTEIFVNDSVVGEIVKDTIRYKFALTIKDKVPPPPVEGIEVEDEKNAEASVVVFWKKNTATDTVYYNVYYNETYFDDASTTTLFDKAQESDLEKYNMSVNISEDDTLYYFAVTAVDRAGNENVTVKVIPGVSIDDFAPEPIPDFTLSIDGAKATIKWAKLDSHKDVVHYNIYQSNKEIKDAEGMTAVKLLIEDSGCLTDLTCEYSITLTSGTHYFAITGVDEVPNENKTIEKSVLVKI